MSRGELFVALVLGIWLIAGFVACWTKNDGPIGAACFVTVIAGIAYVLTR